MDHVVRGFAEYMSATGGDCFPGIKTLARRLGMKERTVTKYRDLLVALGFLEVDYGGGRGRRTGYYATLPVWLDAQLGGRPARARARRAPAVRPQLELVATQDPPAAAAVEPVASQLGAEPQESNIDVDLAMSQAPAATVEPAATPSSSAVPEHADVVSVGQAVREVLEDAPAAAAVEPVTSQLGAGPPSGLAGDVDLAASEASGEASAPAPVTSGDAQGLVRKTYPLGRSGRVGVSMTPSRLPANPGGAAAQSGGTRQQPRPTRPARVPAPVAQVIAALPLSERQRHQARTWPPALEAIASGLASSGATPAELARALDQTRQWPLRDAKWSGSALERRMPDALELLATRRRAEARQRELDAAPSAPPAAKASREVAAAAAAAAHAAIATRPDPTTSPPPASWRRPQPSPAPLPDLLARLEERYGA
jgi:hypothetical protein